LPYCQREIEAWFFISAWVDQAGACFFAVTFENPAGIAFYWSWKKAGTRKP
jgi:hypothetical protein